MLSALKNWLAGMFGAGQTRGEKKVGVVSHYFGKIGVVAIDLQGSLSVGDTVHLKGHTTDFTQKVGSIQIDHTGAEQAGRGDSIGIKVGSRAREHDEVFKVAVQ